MHINVSFHGDNKTWRCEISTVIDIKEFTPSMEITVEHFANGYIFQNTNLCSGILESCKEVSKFLEELLSLVDGV